MAESATASMPAHFETHADFEVDTVSQRVTPEAPPTDELLHDLLAAEDCDLVDGPSETSRRLALRRARLSAIRARLRERRLALRRELQQFQDERSQFELERTRFLSERDVAAKETAPSPPAKRDPLKKQRPNDGERMNNLFRKAVRPVSDAAPSAAPIAEAATLQPEPPPEKSAEKTVEKTAEKTADKTKSDEHAELSDSVADYMEQLLGRMRGGRNVEADVSAGESSADTNKRSASPAAEMQNSVPQSAAGESKLADARFDREAAEENFAGASASKYRRTASTRGIDARGCQSCGALGGRQL